MTEEKTCFIIMPIATPEEIAKKYQDVAAVQAKQLSRKDAWYNSPALWFSTGVVTTIILGIVGAKIYQELK